MRFQISTARGKTIERVLNVLKQECRACESIGLEASMCEKRERIMHIFTHPRDEPFQTVLAQDCLHDINGHGFIRAGDAKKGDMTTLADQAKRILVE